MINFIFSPIKTLFSRKLYWEVSHSPLGKGLIYLSYLGLIYTVGVTIVLAVSVRPVADDFVEWFQKSLPDISFTREGVVTSVTQPFTMTHPEYGTILVIDTTKDMPDMNEMKDSYFSLTKTKLHVWQKYNNQHRIVDIIPQGEKARTDWSDFTLTGPLLQTIYRRLTPFIYVAVFLFCFVGFFIWKFVAALFYSLLALGINLFRKNKLAYSKLLNIAFFALTPVTLLQWLLAFFPNFPFRLNFLWTLLITSLTLCFALLGTQSLDENKTPA